MPVIRWFEHRQVYAPSAALEFAPEHPYENVSFKSPDGLKLHGWFFPGSTRARLAFLIFHGNGGNICHRLAFYDAWLELGVSLFAFDYRGYGQSEGTPSENGTYLDGHAAYGWLRQRGK